MIKMHFIQVNIILLSVLGVKGDEIYRINVDANRIPDSEKRTADFIDKYGYPAEVHEVTTQDNYTLTLYRIPHNGSNSLADRPVVLLQHGIILTSDQWVMRGASEDLVFLLSRQGYDVWMSNTRGTRYSRHSVYTNKDYKFWNYSLHELGNYDLPAIIDYILDLTGKPRLTYVGHSRGCAMATILLSSQPEYNSKINVFLGIAPVIYSKEAKCPIYNLAGNRPSALMKTSTLQKIFERARFRNVLFTTKTMRMMLNRFCSPGALLDNVCPYISFFINGEDFQMFNKTLMPLMISHFTLGVGAKELLHLLQISESDIFRQFDYGTTRNLRIYGTEEPPSYNLTNILVPTYLYYGPNDLFVSERDLYKFAKQLPNFREAYMVPYKKFNHIDYIFAKKANTLLYPQIISVINEHNKIGPGRSSSTKLILVCLGLISVMWDQIRPKSCAPTYASEDEENEVFYWDPTKAVYSLKVGFKNQVTITGEFSSN